MWLVETVSGVGCISADIAAVIRSDNIRLIYFVIRLSLDFVLIIFVFMCCRQIENPTQNLNPSESMMEALVPMPPSTTKFQREPNSRRALIKALSDDLTLRQP